ncbi:MAG: general secretion pathway protein GspK [Candidatus Riflebacteria bacterium]|nr:general secretion pathway protein GspK [Candidatus Riflebacteria bacterium]
MNSFFSCRAFSGRLKRPPGHRDGVALAACVLLLMLMIALYARLSREAVFQMRLDRRQEQSFQARLAAQAGLSLGLSLLYRDRNTIDYFGEEWSRISSYTQEKGVEIGGGTFTLRISDEAGKLNVNMANEETLYNLFDSVGLGIVENLELTGEKDRRGASRRLAQRIMDYIDADENPRPMGSESTGYEWAPGKKPRNAPLEDLRELLNIPGITNDIYLAKDGRPGLSDLLTIYTDGLININTARPEVIEAVPGPPGYDGERRRAFLDEMRRRIPFTDPTGMLNFYLAVDRACPQEYRERLILFSTCFRVESTGRMNEIEKRLIAIVRRDRYGLCRVDRIAEMP